MTWDHRQRRGHPAAFGGLWSARQDGPIIAGTSEKQARWPKEMKPERFVAMGKMNPVDTGFRPPHDGLTQRSSTSKTALIIAVGIAAIIAGGALFLH
jgi:hypothetical protein